MRYKYPLIILVPVVILSGGCSVKNVEPFVEGQAHGGRGFVNPPTVSEMKQIKCLATMIYGEARGETYKGKVAVAYTAKNRAVKRSLCDVVLAPKQYSIFNNNPALRAAALSPLVTPKQSNLMESAAWHKSQIAALDVYTKTLPDPTAGSTHYLAPVAMKRLGYKYPKWSKEFKMVAVVDNHVFYKSQDKRAAKL